MTFCSILTYVDHNAASADRLRCAIAMARHFDAHLTALAIGHEPNIPPYAYDEAAGAVVADLLAAAKSDAAAQAAAAQETIAGAGLRADADPLICRYGEFARDFGERAQFADLVVLSRPYGDTAARTVRDAFEGALFDGEAAILVCPPGTDEIRADSVVIAWNGTREALRATRRALPLLSRSKNVEIVLVDPPAGNPGPGERLATLLWHHGITADIVVRRRTGGPISPVLHQRVDERGAGLVVMGGYGHSRFRECVIGGVTRDFLSTNTVPVLMAH